MAENIPRTNTRFVSRSAGNTGECSVATSLMGIAQSSPLLSVQASARRLTHAGSRVSTILPSARMPTALDLTNLPDADVVALAQAGREAAFRELIRRYERPVFSLIYRMIRDREL